MIGLLTWSCHTRRRGAIFTWRQGATPTVRRLRSLHVDRHEQAPGEELAEAFRVVEALDLVDLAARRGSITTSERAMMLEQLAGDAVTVAAVFTVGKQLEVAARRRKAGKGSK